MMRVTREGVGCRVLRVPGVPGGPDRLPGLLPGLALGGPLPVHVLPHHALPFPLRTCGDPTLAGSFDAVEIGDRTDGAAVVDRSTSRGRSRRLPARSRVSATSRRPANGALGAACVQLLWSCVSHCVSRMRTGTGSRTTTSCVSSCRRTSASASTTGTWVSRVGSTLVRRHRRRCSSLLMHDKSDALVFFVLDIYQRVGLSKSGKPGLLSTMVSFFVSALWHVRS